MNKGALLETLETVLVVTVIAVLIWLFAEGETIQPVTKTVAIEFVAPNPTLAVEVNGGPAEARPLEVEINLQVSRSNRSKIEEFLQGQPAIRIEVRPTANGNPEQIIDLKNELSTSSLAEMGAYIQSTDPPTATVELIELRKISMSIEAVPGELELSPEAPPVFDPPQVQVMLPKDLADLAQTNNLSLLALMDDLDPSDYVEDTPYSERVKLALPIELMSDYAKFDDFSEVRFLVIKSSRDYTLERVQIRVTMSDAWAGKQPITIDDSQQFIEVQLNGPAEVIDQIERDEANELVWATLRLNSDDLTEGDHQAPLVILVPEGVTVVSPQPLPLIDYEVPLTAETP